jgi:hypothetical protein
VAQQDREAVVALEALGAHSELVSAALVARRAQQDHREIAPEDRHARVLEVGVAVVDESGQLRDEARAIAPDGGQDEPTAHGHPPDLAGRDRPLKP